ncbi:MAG: aminotransferase class V-fold PLP-dependent enzyme [Proteobacteria bacterium]|nr:aminotransferase class V-fold PLP-dependent enzyme [Pseudomonadota bacterium]
MSNLQAEALDAADPLRPVRERFDLSPDLIYLDGNSLGPLPIGVSQAVQTTLDQDWQSGLVRSWNQADWIDLPEMVGEQIAPLLGAAAGQVICCDSTSVNLFKVLAAAVHLIDGPATVLTETGNFPSDLYIADGLRQLMGSDRLTIRSVPGEQLFEALDRSVSILMLTHVNFRNGALHDLRAFTQRAASLGILTIWDLSHSTGIIDLELDDAGVDFAVGYWDEYLCGGPGAPGYVYVAHRHQKSARQPLSGWMGHAEPFAFSPEFTSAQGMKQFLTGTPAILSMVALSAALKIFDGIDLQAVRHKSRQLGDFWVSCMNEAHLPVRLASPSDASDRGAQVCYHHSEAYAVIQALADMQVLGDFRAPDVMRFGFHPLFTSFTDLAHAASRLTEVIQLESFKAERYQARKAVT